MAGEGASSLAKVCQSAARRSALIWIGRGCSGNLALGELPDEIRRISAQHTRYGQELDYVETALTALVLGDE